MHRSIATVIVGLNAPFREALSNHLRPPAFRLLATKPSLSDIVSGELPRSERCLVVIECRESPLSLTAKIAQLKEQNPLVRVALLGQHWAPADIAGAFKSGANAYFAEAIMSEEFVKAIELITR